MNMSNTIFRAKRCKYLTTTKLAIAGARCDYYNVCAAAAPGHFIVVDLRMKLASFSLANSS
jgi:hypothetical protein